MTKTLEISLGYLQEVADKFLFLYSFDFIKFDFMLQ